MLHGKRILLGISASIAAYKSAYLVRLFVKSGAEVKVVLTPDAKEFVTPLTLSTLSKNPVLSEFTDQEDENAVWNNHVDIGLWADLMVIAPATANTMAKMANGVCDNLLLATYLSAKCPVYIAPAMDLDMYKHGSTHKNLSTLTSYGNKIIAVGTGELASGLVGEGRMAEPEDIVNFITKSLANTLPLAGKKVLLTAGPTYEAIDPVRFIGNHSSGKMGIALAVQAARKGATVTLVLGPTLLDVPHPDVEVIRVNSAAQMYDAVMEHQADTDIAILSAAVADYRPKTIASEKIKKAKAQLHIDLEPTQDILAELGKKKKEGQYLVGFALETQNEQDYARGKLKKKNLDLIVLNSLRDKGAGFGHDTNKISLIDKSNKITDFELKSKKAVAKDIINYIIDQTHE